MRKQKERNSIVIIVAYVVLGIFSFMCIAPVVLMAVASFTDNDVLNLYGYTYFPQKWSLEAYEFLIKQGTVISKSLSLIQSPSPRDKRQSRMPSSA